LGGETFDMTYDAILALWMHTEAGNLPELLRTKGLNVEIYTRNMEWEHLLNRKVIRTSALTLREIREATDRLADELREVAEVVFKTNYEKQTPAINKTSLEWANHEIRQDERHWHISREIEEGPEVLEPCSYLLLDQQSRYMPKTGGDRRINLVPFAKEFVCSMQMDASFYGMTIPLATAKGSLCDRQWRQKMKDLGHERHLNALMSIVRQITIRSIWGS
jgi:hypothetical protein